MNRITPQVRRAADRALARLWQSGGEWLEGLDFSAEQAAILQIKASLITALRHWIAQSSLKQAEVARILAVTRPRVSDLVTGKVSKFSIDALVDMLHRAGLHVQVKVS